jgi:hypothetical protein
MRPSRRTRKVDPANRRFPNSLFRRCSDGASLPDHCMNDSELCIAYPVSPELVEASSPRHEELDRPHPQPGRLATVGRSVFGRRQSAPRRLRQIAVRQRHRSAPVAGQVVAAHRDHRHPTTPRQASGKPRSVTSLSVRPVTFLSVIYSCDSCNRYYGQSRP